MMGWLDDHFDEVAALEEHTDNAEPIAWARSLRRDHGREGAVEGVLGSLSVPPAVRRIALEELAL
jgi:hypothetical protein